MEKIPILVTVESYTISRVLEEAFAGEKEIRLLTCSDGHDFHNDLLKIKPAVLLLDYKLTWLNLNHTCEFIRDNPELISTQILLLKSKRQPGDREMMNQLGIIGMIEKPFSAYTLLDEVKDLLLKVRV